MPASAAGVRKGVGCFDVLVVAGFLAAAFTLCAVNAPGLIGLYNDDSFYALVARQLAERGPAGLDSAHALAPSRFPVGFPAVLAALWILGGRDFAAIPVWEAFVAFSGFGFLLGSYLLLTRAWAINQVVAGLAVCLLAIHPITLKYAAVVMSDVPGAAVTTAGLGVLEVMRRKPAAKWPVALAGLLLGYAFLVRYAALMLAVAALAASCIRRRWSAGLATCAVASAVAAPWVAWVLGHQAFGYATEYSLSAPARSYLESVFDAISWLFCESLPGLILPIPFLRGIESLPMGVQPRLESVIGSGIAIAVIAACATNLRRDDRLVPALYTLLTLVLIVAWSGRFPKLGWDLQVRLLLPVAPILLAFAFEAGAHQLAGLAPLRRRLVAAGAIASLLFVLGTDARIAISEYARIAERNREYTDFLSAMLAARAYLARIPADVRVGTPYAAQAAFYISRRFEPVLPTEAGLENARRNGVRLILATPYNQVGRDYMNEAIVALVAKGRARVLFAPRSNVAIVHLPAAP